MNQQKTAKLLKKVVPLPREVTHSYPHGILGAQAVALAIFKARMGGSAENIREAVLGISKYDLTQTVDKIRPNYHFDETYQGTVPQAIICALEAPIFRIRGKV